MKAQSGLTIKGPVCIISHIVCGAFFDLRLAFNLKIRNSFKPRSQEEQKRLAFKLMINDHLHTLNTYVYPDQSLPLHLNNIIKLQSTFPPPHVCYKYASQLTRGTDDSPVEGPILLVPSSLRTAEFSACRLQGWRGWQEEKQAPGMSDTDNLPAPCTVAGVMPVHSDRTSGTDLRWKEKGQPSDTKV